MLAVVDVIHTANLGYGRMVGLSFVHAPNDKHVTDVVADKTKTADLKIRNLGNGQFEVTDRHGKHQATEGVPIIATDSLGARTSTIAPQVRTARSRMRSRNASRVSHGRSVGLETAAAAAAGSGAVTAAGGAAGAVAAAACGATTRSHSFWTRNTSSRGSTDFET